MTNDVMYGEFIEALLLDDNVDSVVVEIVPYVENIKATPDNCHDEDSFANIIVRLFKKYDKPMVVSVNAGEYYGEFVDIMEKAGIPVYSDIRAAVRILDIYTSYHAK